jgi:hypothetical protein
VWVWSVVAWCVVSAVVPVVVSWLVSPLDRLELVEDSVPVVPVVPVPVVDVVAVVGVVVWVAVWVAGVVEDDVWDEAVLVAAVPVLAVPVVCDVAAAAVWSEVVTVVAVVPVPAVGAVVADTA